MKDKARIAAVSLPAGEETLGLPDVTAETVIDMLDGMKRKSIDLVLFPQYSGYGRNPDDTEKKRNAFSCFAAENGCYVVYNTLEEDGKDKKCVSVIIGRDGSLHGTYVKTHAVEGIDIDLSPGNEIPVFELDFGKVALMAGSDIYIPELAEIYSIKGAEILLCSLGILPLRDDTESARLLRGRAIADYYYIAASTYASSADMYMINSFEPFNRDDGYSPEEMKKSFNSNGLGRHTGRAAIYDMRGDVIASTGREKGVAECEVDLSKKRYAEKYIYGPAGIVYHQNQRGVFGDLLREGRYKKKAYPVEKPVTGIVHMTYDDTINNRNDRKWFKKVCEYIVGIAKGCDIVISSECSRMEYNPGGRVKVEDQDEKIGMYSACARENNCYIAVNDCFDGINTSLLFDRKGDMVHRYSKVNTTSMMYKRELPTGTEIEVVETDFGRIGFTICADSYCQEISRILGIKGVEIIINQTQSWGYDADAINEGIFRAWAVENCVYVVTSAFPSSQVRLRSNIIDPTGETVFATDYDREGAYTARLNLDAVRSKVSFVYGSGRVVKDYNLKSRLLKARRPELYGLLSPAEG